MSSIRDQIVQAVVDRLNGAGKPADVVAHRYSLSKIDFVSNPTQKPIVVYPSKDTPQPPKKGQGLLQRTLLLSVDSYALGEPIDQVLDPSLCWVTATLGADASLGGLVLDVREGTSEWDEEMAVQGVGLCKQVFEIDYIHNRLNQESQT